MVGGACDHFVYRFRLGAWLKEGPLSRDLSILLKNLINWNAIDTLLKFLFFECYCSSPVCNWYLSTNTTQVHLSIFDINEPKYNIKFRCIFIEKELGLNPGPLALKVAPLTINLWFLILSSKNVPKETKKLVGYCKMNYKLIASQGRYFLRCS